MARHAVVVNPMASKCGSKEFLQRIEEKLTASGQEYRIFWSESEGNIERLAKEAAASYDRVWAVGGDGTLNDAARGVYGSGAELAVLPMGTGNDFVKTAGIPLDFEEAVALAVNGTAKPIDVGFFDGKLFVNVAGMGFDADTAAGVGKFTAKGFTGLTAYLLSLFATLFTLKNRHTVLELDGKRLEYDAIMVDVGNGRYIGGGICICPDAVLNDGVFQVCVAHDIPKYKVPFLLSHVVKGTHSSLKYIDFFNASKITIKVDETVNMQIDGQIHQGDHAEVELIKNGLNVVMP